MSAKAFQVRAAMHNTNFMGNILQCNCHLGLVGLQCPNGFFVLTKSSYSNWPVRLQCFWLHYVVPTTTDKHLPENKDIKVHQIPSNLISPIRRRKT